MRERIGRREVIAGVIAAGAAGAAQGARRRVPSHQPTPPQPPTGGDAGNERSVEISGDTIREAQRLIGLEFDEGEREEIARGYERTVGAFRARRQIPLENDLAPAHVFDARLSAGRGEAPVRQGEALGGVQMRRSEGAPALPDLDEDIAFAPVAHLSRWIESRAITSERLTRIYLDRIRRFAPRLECIITVTEDLALEQARAADAEIAAGRYRGPLHGLPWGAKDLFDTAGIRTTWGAMPYKDRVPDRDAFVVSRLRDAGAVLIAKTTLGALAYGDIWFGGVTKNPWDLSQGSSGSSAGSASGTAAGLFAFSLGTETLGSIVSPCMRCGTTGLRPTFGRVARTGAMALCWSLDKIGPICRGVEDCAIVLSAISGSDPGDPSSVDAPLSFDASMAVGAIRVGFDPRWFERASDVDRSALEALRTTGVQLIEKRIETTNPAPLMTILNVEAAAAFEELTLSGRDDELVWQEPQAWPNTFRKAWFTPAIELVQAERLRRRLCREMDGVFSDVDLLFGPSFTGGMLLITNNTGHPSITLRAGFRAANRPMGVTFWGRLFDEGTLCRCAMALERALGVAQRRPTASLDA